MGERLTYLSHVLSTQTPAYGGAQNQVKITQERSLKAGDTSNNLHLSFPAHIGTHLDCPAHFCLEGACVDRFDAQTFVCENVGFISCEIEAIEQMISKLDSGIEALIVRTGFEAYRGQERYTQEQPIIEPSLAKILRHAFPNLRFFGFDLISVSSMLNRPLGREAHRAFLCDADIMLIEDMALAHLEEEVEIARLVIAPLRVEEGDGVPCTIIGWMA